MADKCVVRNAQYKRGGLNIRERHNERKNTDYMNEDIIKDRAVFNVHFKQSAESYESTFDQMLADKTISTRGLGKDPHIVDELVFDVNSSYFENNGGYEYAKSFFEEAYRLAVHEIGGEQYVLSAVMHADERNKALSEQYGHPVYHYHLHVVYVPVVQKEIYFKKNNKNSELAGKLKEVITQVSHSKKWPRFKDDKGWVNSYSLLQDRFFEHMKVAGFLGFERGERGSTAEHLSVLEYKSQQESQRATELSKEVKQKLQQSEKLDKKLSVQKKADTDIATLDSIGKKNLVGQTVITPDELKSIKNIIKKEAKSQEKITAQKLQISSLTSELNRIKYRLQGYEGKGITDNMKYYSAYQRAPLRMAEVIADIMRKPPELEQQQKNHTIIKKKGQEL